MKHSLSLLTSCQSFLFKPRVISPFVALLSHVTLCLFVGDFIGSFKPAEPLACGTGPKLMLNKTEDPSSQNPYFLFFLFRKHCFYLQNPNHLSGRSGRGFVSYSIQGPPECRSVVTKHTGSGVMDLVNQLQSLVSLCQSNKVSIDLCFCKNPRRQREKNPLFTFRKRCYAKFRTHTKVKQTE